MSGEVDSVRAEVDGHAKRDALAALVRTVAISAADERRLRLGDGLDELLTDAELSADDGAVGSFNVVKALGRAEPPIVQGRMTVALLLAHGVAQAPPEDEAAAKRLAEQLCWLAAHSWIDALWCLDDALDDEHATRVWDAVADLLKDHDERGTPKGRAEALAAAAALATSRHPSAVERQMALAMSLRDPLLTSLLRSAAEPPAPTQAAVEGEGDSAEAGEDTKTTPFARPTAPSTSLSGELVPAPLGPVGLVLWSVSGLILVRYLFRFIANTILRFKRPAELTVASNGLTCTSRLDVLGRTVRTDEVHIPMSNLARAVKQVRYPRVSLYAGLIALGVGTYVGTWLVTDGGRAGSPSLLGLGALVFAAGVITDLVFANLVPAGRSKYRLLFVPRKGRAIALATKDEDAALQALNGLSGASS